MADSMTREHPLTDIVAGSRWAYRGYEIVMVGGGSGSMYPDFDVVKDGELILPRNPIWL